MIIGIVGIGLIGSSIAKCLIPTEHTVYGFDSSTQVNEHAIEIKLVEDIMPLKEMTSACDLIVLCVPSRKVVELLDISLSGKAIVTDVASVKKNIFEHLITLDKVKQSRFFGGHPMAGSEQSGIKAGRADLFRGRLWVSVLPNDIDMTQFSIIKEFISMLGAEQTILSAQDHDELVAYSSHLPQLCASVLMDLANAKSQENVALLRLVAGGFRDMTRIASSNPEIWLDIVNENSNSITDALDSYIAALTSLKDAVASKDNNTIANLFSRARNARVELPESAKLEGEYDEIIVGIKNEPGTIEQIISFAKNINIYDIRIEHSPSGSEGLMKLLVDRSSGQQFEATLINANFEVSRSELTI